jgi:anti-anti-sigma factor
MVLSSEGLEKSGDVIVLRLQGPRATQLQVAQFHEQIKPLVEKESPRIILDLSLVEFIDSSFVGALVVVLKRCLGGGGDLKLCGLTPPLRTLLEMLRLNRVFDIQETEDSARRAFLARPE